MRVLVTGGAGFIGSHLVAALLGEGHDISVQDNLVTGDRENLTGLPGDRLRFEQADICEGIAFEGPFDRVYNLASPASPKDFTEIPLEILRVGADGTRNVAEASLRWRARLLHASTSEVYGDPLVHPQTEDYFGNVNPVGLRSVYDESKRYSEALLAAHARLHGMEIRLARIFNTYGPRMRLDDGRVIPNFARQALSGEALTVYGDGTQTRSFCYVEDLVAGLMALMESDVAEPVNLGNPAEMSMEELARRVVEMTGSRSEVTHMPLPHADDPRKRRPDIGRARERLGWEPRVAFEEGLGRTLDDFRRRMG